MATFPQQLKKVFIALCDEVGSPLAARAANLVRDEEFRQLVEMTIDPGTYSDPDLYLQDVAVVDFFRKCQFNVPGIDRVAVAESGFLSSEQTCKKTNDRLSPFIHARGPFEDPNDLIILQHIADIRSWIRGVLGPAPHVGALNPRFGPGATLKDVGKYVTVPDKISARPTISESAYRLFMPVWQETAWARTLLSESPDQHDPLVVSGNRFTTVPKDARKDRGIAIEPSINVFYQLAVGALIKERLFAQTGVSLHWGQDRHRSLAESGSRTNLLSTIDLSNASDTVAKGLVELLLPKGWFDLLTSLRSRTTLFRGRPHHLEKFSSMGNGFTFELESLIFLAIAVHACKMHGIRFDNGRTISVFGDDIIVPRDAADTALSLLRFFGFTPNGAKTFIQGPFRESCGGDYFLGRAVRPFQLKEIPDEPAKWISLANGLRRMGCQNPSVPFRFSFVYSAWLRCIHNIPTDIRRLRGPSYLGDLVIHDDDRSYWQLRQVQDKDGERGFLRIRVWAPVSKPLSWQHWKPEVVYASALYGCETEGVTPRGGVSGYRFRWVEGIS